MIPAGGVMEPAQVWTGQRAEVRFCFPSPRLFLHRVTGHYDVEAVRFVFGRLEAHFSAQRQMVEVFGDLDVTGYDSALRDEADVFVRRFANRIPQGTLLASNAMALAALSVLKLRTPIGMTVLSSRADYQAALLDVLRRATRAPSSRWACAA
jgi:hypothetical protein